MARHVYRCSLRWSDMDAFGHVNNVVFLRYLEEARIDLMFRLAREDGSASFSGGSVVARHEIDYLRPLVHRHEPVIIESWVAGITAASVTIAYEIKDSEDNGSVTGTVYARAKTLVVPYDLKAQRPRRITDEEQAFLEGFREEGQVPAGREGSRRGGSRGGAGSASSGALVV
ncbi:thioesterase family protein [Streptomyces sp. TS71-3]|uniref:acyl-CoA thioesterase n=1 Tax=Streptomyces sp. TS71-3 TaxID=2733862 RepID=UPI001B00698B|nr:thioesterase family protein [Streptomyces sp. TS71-3]GHJ37554.1 thioesterase [Streptomyces sp. TS71-3]